MTIGKSIKHIRKNQLGENQKTFASSIGTGQAYLSRIENDHSKPTIALLESISERAGTPLPILFWFGIEESDIHDKKVEAFKMLKPTIDSMINELI